MNTAKIYTSFKNNDSSITLLTNWGVEVKVNQKLKASLLDAFSKDNVQDWAVGKERNAIKSCVALEDLVWFVQTSKFLKIK